MEINRNAEIAAGNNVFRHEIILILQNAISIKEYRFARNLASHWLKKYPGDLQVDLLHAQALLQDGREDLGIPILKRVSNTDPEFLPAQRLLALAGNKTQYSTSKAVWGNIKGLGGKGIGGKDIPSWSQSIAKARKAIQNKEEELAEDLINQALSEDPDSPLPAIMHLNQVSKTYDWQTLKVLSEKYHNRWADCLQISLYLADSLMNLGQEEKAVDLLHLTATLDIAAQVPQRLWGKEFPYKNMWQSNFHITLPIPFPANVIAALGWNQLAVGEPIINSKEIPSAKEPLEAKDLAGNLDAVKDEFARIALKLRKPELGRDEARFPIFVVLTTREGLEKQYGAKNLPLIDQAMKSVVRSSDKLHRWDSQLIYVDDEDTVKRYGIPPASANEPWSIKNFLSDLDESYRKTGEMIGALLIVGGPKVVPFHRLPNPIDDIDAEVLSDNPYATADENYFIPTWPIGRLPGSNTTDPRPLIKQLNEIVKRRNVSYKKTPFLERLLDKIFGKKRKTDSFGYSAQIWRRASNSVFRPIGKPERIKISPPTLAVEFDKKPLKPVQLAYYNLHGLEDAPEWYGQRDPVETKSGEDYPVALRPQDIVNSGRAPQIVFSEACYGANIISKSVEDAISLKFLDSGTQTVVGSTCTSYGSVTTPLIAADLLGKLFWNYLQAGYPTGLSLQRAKIELAKQMHKRQGYLDGEDQKTLISFVLYGDPLAQPQLDGPNPKSGLRPDIANPHVNIVCAKSSVVEESVQTLPPAMMKQVKSVVREYLPGMAGADYQISQEHNESECEGHNCPTKHLGSKNIPGTYPNRSVITLKKSITTNKNNHSQIARITMNKEGEIVKLAVSR